MGIAATISALVLALPFIASAAIAQIAFTSPQQAIEPGAVSGMITIEAEDASGAPANGQTVCLSVSSDSPTGALSTNASSWPASSTRSLALTISSNQYRRNVYYQDSTEGTVTLSAKAALRPGGSACSAWKGAALWTAAQPIVVKIGASIPPPPPPPAVPAVSASTKSKSTAHTASKTKARAVSNQAPSTQDASGGVVVGAPALPTPLSQAAASTAASSDILWWILAVALIAAGCSFLVLSQRHKKTEWNIVEEEGPDTHI